MTPQQVLRYQLALLLASNGRATVVAALAELLKLRQEDLERELATLEGLEPKCLGKAKASGSRPTLDMLMLQHPDKADALQTLNTRLANKTFLADLREVRRFMESHGHPPNGVKSRTDAVPKLLKVLATLDSDELKNLCEQPDDAAYSSLGIISDHIMGRDRR